MSSTGSVHDGRAVTPAERHVLGRSREGAAIEELLARADQLPRAVAIEGEAGIGKTTVWLRAIEEARARDYHVIQARPAQAEAALAFAGLGDLLSDAYPEIAPSLPAPQRHALAAALLLDDSPGAAIDRRTVGVAVLTALRVLSDGRPLFVAIDDEQWLDEASDAALGFALRRLRAEPVAVLIARRPQRPADEPSEGLETRLASERFSLGPISVGALHAIVVERFGVVLARPRLRRLHDLSRGNPFLAIELVRAAQAGRLRLDASEPVAADLDSLLGTRFEALPASTKTALLAAATASSPNLDLLGRIGQAEPMTLLAPAVDAGIVELESTEIRFSHPLLASAAYGAATSTERQQMHARLAGVVGDPSERARHAALAAVQPDEAVAADVERAAAAVFGRGAPAAAAELAELAARLTPPDHADAARRRTATLAEYLFESGDPAAAGELLDQDIATTPRGRARATILALQARIRHFGDDIEAGVDLNRQALAEAHGDDRLVAGIHEGLAWGLFLVRKDLPAAARHARSAVRAARRTENPVALAEGLAAQAITHQAIGRPAPAELDEAMALEPHLLDLRVLRHPSYAKGYLLACSDNLEAAAAVFNDLLARAEERGDESAVPPILIQLSMVEILSGAWDSAAAHARDGYALAIQVGQRPSQAALLSRSALLAALRGDIGVAETLGQQALALTAETSDLDAVLRAAPTRGGELAVWALGSAALAGGDYDRADAYLGPLVRTLLDAGMREPGELRFLPDAIEALLGQGRVDDADALVGTMEAMARRLRRSTTLGVASRARAEVAMHLGQAGVALASAERAVALLDGGPLPFERARARLVLGEVQRRARQKRDARETLDAAAREFEELGAAGWAARARAETARIGGRPKADGTLTPTEMRVAELVTEGLANKEAAHVLGVGQKTVELHLSHIYAKLGVGSRTELVRLLMASASASASESLEAKD